MDLKMFLNESLRENQDSAEVNLFAESIRTESDITAALYNIYAEMADAQLELSENYLKMAIIEHRSIVNEDVELFNEAEEGMWKKILEKIKQLGEWIRTKIKAVIAKIVQLAKSVKVFAKQKVEQLKKLGSDAKVKVSSTLGQVTAKFKKADQATSDALAGKPVDFKSVEHEEEVKALEVAATEAIKRVNSAYKMIDKAEVNIKKLEAEVSKTEAERAKVQKEIENAMGVTNAQKSQYQKNPDLQKKVSELQNKVKALNSAISANTSAIQDEKSKISRIVAAKEKNTDNLGNRTRETAMKKADERIEKEAMKESANILDSFNVFG
jgi:hypothetical protein